MSLQLVCVAKDIIFPHDAVRSAEWFILVLGMCKIQTGCVWSALHTEGVYKWTALVQLNVYLLLYTVSSEPCVIIRLDSSLRCEWNTGARIEEGSVWQYTSCVEPDCVWHGRQSFNFRAFGGVYCRRYPVCVANTHTQTTAILIFTNRPFLSMFGVKIAFRTAGTCSIIL